jgi:hypothetical protein
MGAADLDRRTRRDDAWVLVVVGALAADAVWVSLAPRPTRVVVSAEPSPPPDPSHASPRELRTLPGIGEARAIAIATERWRLEPGATRALSEVDGIGPVIEGGVRALREHAAMAAGRSEPGADAVDSSTSFRPPLGAVQPLPQSRTDSAPAADRPP